MCRSQSRQDDVRNCSAITASPEMILMIIIQSTCCISSRGKGDYFRLGHGSDTHVRKPQLVEGLKGKKIVHISVGALHCLAVTSSGEVSCHPFGKMDCK